MTAVTGIAAPIVPVSPGYARAQPWHDHDAAGAFTGAPSHYGRNELIFGERDPAEYVYRVQCGAVRLFRVLSDGRRQIGAFYFTGDIFGLEPGDEHSFSAESIGDSEIVVTSRQTVFRLAEHDSAFARQLWNRAAADLATARDHMLLLGRQTATERVAAFLMAMAEREHSERLVALPMSRQDIADYLGLTIETVSRTLTLLTGRMLIDVPTSRRILLRDPAALRRLNA